MYCYPLRTARWVGCVSCSVIFYSQVDKRMGPGPFSASFLSFMLIRTELGCLHDKCVAYYGR